MLLTIRVLQQAGCCCRVAIPGDGVLAKKLEEMEIPYLTVSMAWWVSPVCDKKMSLLQTIQYKLNSFIHRIRKKRLNNKTIRQLSEWLTEEGCDLIWTNSVVIDLGIILSDLIKVRHVWHIREVIDLHFKYQFDKGWKRSIKRILNSNLVFTVSDVVKNHYFKGINLDKVHRVYDSIDFDSTASISENEKMADGSIFKFAFVGYVEEAKGQWDALEALAQLRDKGINARIIFIGGGKTEHLRQHAEQLRLIEQVEITGYLDDPNDILASADAAIVCSVFEAFGRCAVEAMANGIPVVARNSGANPELIEDGKTGFLYDGSIESLTQKLEYVILNPNETRIIGKSARQIAGDKFSFEQFSEQILKIIKEDL